MKIGYWPIKGVTEPTRLLLAYLKTPYTEENPKSQEEWYGEKKQELIKGGLEFPNLPYLIDGDFKITESSAIPIYISGKANRSELFGACFKEQAKHQMLLGVLKDMKKEIFEVVFGRMTPEDFSKGKFGTKLQDYSKFVGDNKFSLGNDVRFADLAFVTLMDAYVWVTGLTKQENLLLKYKNLAAVVNNVKELDGIKEYLTTDRAKRPLLPPNYVKI